MKFIQKLQLSNNKQKIIFTIWVILIIVSFICSLSPIVIKQGELVISNRLEINFETFISLILIITIPSYVLFLIWKDMKT